MFDLKELQNQDPIDSLEQQKNELESKIAISQGASSKGVNISQLAMELAFVTEIYNLTKELHSKMSQFNEANEILAESDDKEMLELARLEKEELEAEIVRLDKLITKRNIEQKLSDPDDQKSVIIEIRAGAGGQEASLFAAELFRMYQNFANNKNWKLELLSTNTSDAGGYKEVVAKIDGRNAYKYLKYESGVHRVQRIPATESGGRIHTSTASVAILPEAEAVEVNIREEDLKIETMRASGAGGQHVNKTSSAIRITHIPTGVVASCQDSKVQQENKKRAMQLLTARVYEMQKEEEMKKRSDMRSSQIGTAMRSEKIRTYNFPQSRITDHRVKISWHNLEEALAGGLEEILNELNDAMLQLMLDALEIK